MSTLDNDCQNPVYPDDRFLTDDEIGAKARECSMMRARSPGERICIIDQVSTEDEPGHVHDYATCMAWPHAHAIADDAPWIYWLLYDQWAQIAPDAPPS
jgi:hypothetical protein